MAKQNGETKSEEPKSFKRPKYTPPTPEVLSEVGEFDVWSKPERKVKGGGVRPAEDIKIATNRKQALALYNNDEKAMLFGASIFAHLASQKHAAKNDPTKVAARTSKWAEKQLSKMDPSKLEALKKLLAAQ